jgi:hypothetical protein
MENFERGLDPKEAMNIGAINIKCINKYILDSGINNLVNILKMDKSEGFLSYLDYTDLKAPEHSGAGLDKLGVQTIGLKVRKEYIKTSQYHVSASFTKAQQNDFSKFGVDVNNMLINVLTNESIHGIYKQIMDNIKTCSIETIKNEYTIFEKILDFLFKLFKKEYTKKFKPNDIKHLYKKILFESNKIALTTRRGPANFVVLNTRMAAIFQHRLPDFVFVNTNLNNGTIYPIGTMTAITFYVDPNMSLNDNTIYVGRISGDESDIGLKFCFDTTGTSINTTKEPNNDVVINCLTLRYAIKKINDNGNLYYRKIVVNDKKLFKSLKHEKL